jgi:Heparinase II/III-like protein/Heparinase II/III N-terminus
MTALKTALQLLQNMGLRYVWFRVGYEIKRRTGLLKRVFPTKVKSQTWATLQTWQQLPTSFFDFDRIAPRTLSASLADEVAQYEQGKLLFFGAQYYDVPNWHINPDTRHQYNPNQHWTEIADLSATAGDIKYVWEKSRFSVVYSLIRYDFHANEDMSEVIFAEIDSWIAANPVNCGPNWRCSQEISLRVLNWTFALHYYKNSPALTPARFEAIVDSVYWQMKHVAQNIDFSRIAVRNNHAITETLTLYLVGLLYPFFDESPRWKQQGKRWFEEEIAYQIYEDGTFLQFSMNYHRVVVQLLTWGLQLAHLNHERFAKVVYDRARASLHFLQTCQDPVTGWLPNYGNNDGALFFRLNNAHYRDYRPQLNALAAVLNLPAEWHEDLQWYGIQISNLKSQISNNIAPNLELTSFPNSGYYVLREGPSLTFLRCGSYQNRPFQADNLHLDIWINGQNLLRDAGSYKYNTDERWTRYFAGTASHNTVMLDSFDQMQKGGRFVWYNWTKNASGAWTEKPDCWVFEGKINAFEQAGKGIYHHRRVTKMKHKNHWIVEDTLENAPAHLPMHQIWHPMPQYNERFEFRAFDDNGQQIEPTQTEGWYSSLYGQKELAPRLVFSTPKRYLKTEILER